MLPDLLRYHIEELLETKVSVVNTVGGGSINQAARVETADRQTYFFKWNSSTPSDMFPKEKKGLELLASVDCGLRIPEVIECGSKEDGIDFLLIEFIPEDGSSAETSRTFGRALAEQHKITEEKYGLDYDNYIGRLPQLNRWHENWIDFFVEERLNPQLQMAVDEGKLSSDINKNFNRLFKNLPGLLPDEPASLLHGDLWGGNYFYDEEGAAAIFDPAVYYGNREIEMAFTHLFGGFSAEFYDAYQQTFPLKPDFHQRKDIYNLYPLLVHTNMFGGHYGRQVKGIVERY